MRAPARMGADVYCKWQCLAAVKLNHPLIEFIFCPFISHLRDSAPSIACTRLLLFSRVAVCAPLRKHRQNPIGAEFPKTADMRPYGTGC